MLSALLIYICTSARTQPRPLLSRRENKQQIKIMISLALGVNILWNQLYEQLSGLRALTGRKVSGVALALALASSPEAEEDCGAGA